MEKKLQKIYLTYNNFLIEQSLWQAHYQILSAIKYGHHNKKCKIRGIRSM